MAVSHEQAESIRKQHEAGDTYAALAAEYGISKLSVKNIVKFKTHAIKGDHEMRPRYVQTQVPAEMYLQIEMYAEKQQIDMGVAVLRMLQYAVKLNRAFSSAKGTESEPSNA
jgi:predicted transcriptional regulator